MNEKRSRVNSADCGRAPLQLFWSAKFGPEIRRSQACLPCPPRTIGCLSAIDALHYIVSFSWLHTRAAQLFVFVPVVMKCVRSCQPAVASLLI